MFRLHLATVFVVMAAMSAAAATPPSGATVFNVYHYGAVGDGKANDTAAIQRTIDASLTSNPKGLVWVPPNGTHLLGAGLKFIGHAYDGVQMQFDVRLCIAIYLYTFPTLRLRLSL